MRDSPILFSGPMIRAILDGRKTQTRRIVDFDDIEKVSEFVKVGTSTENGRSLYEMRDKFDAPIMRPHGRDSVTPHWSPRFAIGDRLWVRESWQGLSFGDYQPTKNRVCDVRYAATDPCADLDADTRGYPWRPSIHMPRWASRLTLIVADVRVQRLKDIGEEDAIAEGVEPLHQGYYPYGISTFMTTFVAGREVPAQYCPTAHDSFRRLWNMINAARGYGWDINPWVVAITFEVHRGNIDQIEKEAE
ncbi:MAG: hypothetical protein CML31_05280 [Rhizobiales bacterium]|mgnify:FL=1|nr:hypothetical protein [Hoeflea sp.]MBG19365.1 hypothetical protein [Hyphomicrobiales bacterium]|tara:strand:- start:522 stop:1262 length:741 start_codon:yes stop_codon:yes gene_type:complete